MTEEQDDLIYRNNRELFYSFDPETKSYVRNVDYQCNTNQVIIKQSWDALEDRISEIHDKVIRGEISPLAWHMEKHQMDVPMLAGYCGFRKRRVRKHLTVKGFSKITDEERAIYAGVFDITPEKLSSTES